jgi:glycosyl hydrolase family 39 (putative alpha-L-iduronidase)
LLFAGIFGLAGGYTLWRVLASPAPQFNRTIYGLHQDLTWEGGDPYWQNQINDLKAVGGEISRNSFLWNNIESTQGQIDWSRYDTIISRLEAANEKVLFTMYGSPAWANGSTDELVVPGNGSATDPAFRAWADQYADFAAQAAARYKGRIAGWELWNEPNEHYFWKPGPSVDQYEYWYSKVYASMKAADPDVNLAVGGLSGLYASCCILGSTFLTQLIDRGLPIDAVAIHPYDNDAPDHDVAFQPNFTDIGRIRSMLDSRGLQSVKIWATEWGWSGQGATEATQAQYVQKSLEMIRDQYPYVVYATYFVDVDRPLDGYYQGLYLSDMVTPKPAATVFKSFMDSLPPLVIKINGDLNNDSHVDVTDLSILLSNYGKSSSTGDINTDGKVDVTDLSILLSNFGK